MEGNIQIVQVGGTMFIGNLMNTGVESIITNPRVLKIVPVDEKGTVKVHFLKIIGDPKEIKVYEMLFSYAAPDMITRAYMEHVTGLVMARSVPLGRMEAVRGGKS